MYFSSKLESAESESVRIGKCQNRKVLELESVRIGQCQNWKVSESNFCPFLKELEKVRIGKCQNQKVSEFESVRVGKCQNRKVSESESVRIFRFFKYRANDAWVTIMVQTMSLETSIGTWHYVNIFAFFPLF